MKDWLLRWLFRVVAPDDRTRTWEGDVGGARVATLTMGALRISAWDDICQCSIRYPKRGGGAASFIGAEGHPAEALLRVSLVALGYAPELGEALCLGAPTAIRRGLKETPALMDELHLFHANLYERQRGAASAEGLEAGS